MAKVKGPAYQVIHDAILKRINKGVYLKDVPIPSENELAAKYEVSRMTARKSIDMLVAEGYLMRQKGKGTYITGRRNLKKEELSLSARLTEQNHRVFNRVRDLKKTWEWPEVLRSSASAGEETEPSSRPMPGEEAPASIKDGCWKLERLRFVDDVPAILEEVWIPEGHIPDLTEEGGRGSLVELLTRQGELGSMTIAAEAASVERKRVAKALDIKKGDLILKVSIVLFYLDGTPALCSESWQNTSALPFSLTLLK